MNELKPEDVMRALDILDKMDFFQGQRAGRELWFEKPFEVQEQDIADFSQGIAFVKNLIADADARALIREMKKQIRELEGDVENSKSIAEYQQNCNIKRYHQLQEKDDQLVEKDAEIERLTKERDDARRDCAVAEQNHYECKKELETARSEAITAFVDGCVKMAIGLGGIPVVCLESIFQFAKKMKEEKDGESDL